jgi:hypothetical protein
VVAELVAVLHELTDHVWVSRDLAADDEKGRGNVLCAQHGGDLGRPARVGAVVEGQRDASPRRRLARDEPVADGSQDRPQSGERRGAVRVVRLRARPDRVRREPFEEDQRRDDNQAEAEQPPVGRRAPDPPPAERAQGFFLWPGRVVVVAAVVVVECRTCPGAVTDLPGEVAV